MQGKITLGAGNDSKTFNQRQVNINICNTVVGVFEVTISPIGIHTYVPIYLVSIADITYSIYHVSTRIPYFPISMAMCANHIV